MSSFGGGEVKGGRSRTGLVIAGRFTLVRSLGSGGMGEVYEAEDNRIRRRVALKLLPPHYVQDLEVNRRFKREARAAASIEHPNSIVIHDFGPADDGSFYIVQELLKGVDLRAHLQQKRRLSPVEAYEVMAPVMGALVVAHRKNIVHRDIKPENIFLSRSATGETVPKLIDYGIAMMPSALTQNASTQRRALLGTLLYMAPEQANGDGEQMDGRVDVWAVGTVLFELLAGTCPFYAPTAFAVFAKLMSDTPAPSLANVAPDVPAPLAEIVDRALARDPGQRFLSMEAFLRALLKLISRTDPGFAGRHPTSLPPLDEVDLSTDEAGPESAPMSSRALRPVVGPDVEGYADVAAATAPDWKRLAEQALRVNALDEAIAMADGAITGGGASGERLGQLRLVQAIAARWLGRFADAERWAREAAGLLAPGTTGWYSAIGHLALACGAMGKNAELPVLARQLLGVDPAGVPPGAHAMGLSRLVIQLARAGNIELAQHLAREVEETAARAGHLDEVVQAWIDVQKAELALHFGDLTGYLQLVESAVLGFVEAGDPRNACLQRSNIGNAYLMLGVYDRAESILRDALVVGEPMRLHLIGTVQVNLGFTLARLGRLDEALAVASAAHALCARLGYHRSDTFARIYLAEIHRLRGDLTSAEEAARRAVAAAISPATRAYAQATLGHVLLLCDRAPEALPIAREAMATLQSLEGIEEGESLILLVHVLALEANGDRAAAVDHARAAHQRLNERAQTITESSLRRSFLERVPENARIRALVRSP